MPVAFDAETWEPSLLAPRGQRSHSHQDQRLGRETFTTQKPPAFWESKGSFLP